METIRVSSSAVTLTPQLPAPQIVRPELVSETLALGLVQQNLRLTLCPHSDGPFLLPAPVQPQLVVPVVQETLAVEVPAVLSSPPAEVFAPAPLPIVDQGVTRGRALLDLSLGQAFRINCRYTQIMQNLSIGTINWPTGFVEVFVLLEAVSSVGLLVAWDDGAAAPPWRGLTTEYRLTSWDGGARVDIARVGDYPALKP